LSEPRNRTKYFYDAVNRITSAATLSTCTANCWGLTFGLDEWANLLSATATGTAVPVNLAVNTNNQITTNAGVPYRYDASGNELTDVTNTYTWNAESEMKTGGGVTYIYDGRGNRVEKSGTKLYWYGPNGQVLEETDTTGSTTNAAFSEYIYFAGARVARRDYQNNQYYYFEDQVNSSRVIAEVPAGTRTATLCYDADFYPYGGEIDFTNTCSQNYKFQGKERDAETGNDYFGARFYSSGYGRFLSPDWSSVVAPVPYANLTNPQTLNLYAFVNDNPESFADLTGHDPSNCLAVSDSTGSQPVGCSPGTPSVNQASTPANPPQAQNKKSCGFFCGLGQRIKNGFSGYGFRTNDQLKGTVTTMTGPLSIHEVVGATADVAGAVAAVSDNLKLGAAGAAIGIINDPSPENIAITAVGLIPGPDVPIAIGTVAWDGSNFAGGIVQQVFTPDALQSENIDDGSSHTIRSPNFQDEDLCASYGACN